MGIIGDEDGYAFTPLAVLLFIPVIIIAISYGDIVNEANMLAALSTGGDVTITVVGSIYSTVEKAAADAGRNAAYNASRNVIDNAEFFPQGTSKANITENVVNALNDNIINTSLELERQTGRQIYINNVPINNYTSATFTTSDVTLTQDDPFGFRVEIRRGIPLKIVQQDQVYEFTLPPVSSYVSLEGIEDPYIWINTKFRTSNVIYKYPYYATNGTYADYRLNESVDNEGHLQNLWYCLNGTDNPSNITPRPYYFVDPNGLSFFDRLENRSSSADPAYARMSTFIIGDPLLEDHNGNQYISKVDREYFLGIAGTTIKVRNNVIYDPLGAPFCLSATYKNLLGLAANNYN
ncbi:hypothetical protein ACRERI_01910 [Methanothermobacter thermautotrophicus]|uniref:hypothetical protein n=1 Tax=Methanothermobacter thermautotrophicus TaxID=145262 RepID=UPI003D7F5EEC